MCRVPTATHRTPILSVALLVLSSFAFGLVGCQDDPAREWRKPVTAPTASDGSSSSAFYPLADGNSWTYRGSFRVAIDDGTGPPEVDVIESRETRVIDGTETIAGREYIVEHQSLVESIDPAPIEQWIRYRQDRTGLYEADINISDPPGGGKPERMAAERARVRAIPPAIRAGGPTMEEAWQRLITRRGAILSAARTSPSARAPYALEPGEITRLAYPLHPGQAWEIRPDPPFSSEVAGQDQVDVPAGTFSAWEVRIFPPTLEETAEVSAWYGRCGLIRLKAHFEEEVGFGGEEPRGHLIADLDMVLTEISLSDRSHCGRADACADPPFLGITATAPDGASLGPLDLDDWGCSANGRRVVNAAADVPGGPPTDYCFLPAAPNPARTATRLQFTLPELSDVSIDILGTSGNHSAGNARVVRHLLVEGYPLVAGFFEIVWDLRDDDGERVPAGIYRAVFTAEGRVLCGDIEVLDN